MDKDRLRAARQLRTFLERWADVACQIERTADRLERHQRFPWPAARVEEELPRLWAKVRRLRAHVLLWHPRYIAAGSPSPN